MALVYWTQWYHIHDCISDIDEMRSIFRSPGHLTDFDFNKSTMSPSFVSGTRISLTHQQHDFLMFHTKLGVYNGTFIPDLCRFQWNKSHWIWQPIFNEYGSYPKHILWHNYWDTTSVLHKGLLKSLTIAIVCQMLSWRMKNWPHSTNIWDTATNLVLLCSLYHRYVQIPAI